MKAAYATNLFNLEQGDSKKTPMPSSMAGPLKWFILHQQDGLHQLAPVPHPSDLLKKEERLENSIQRWVMVAETAWTGDSAGTYALRSGWMISVFYIEEYHIHTAIVDLHMQTDQVCSQCFMGSDF